jgi:hypothetical protein
MIMNNITIKKRIKTKLVNNIPQTNCVLIMVCNACELVNMKQAWRSLKQSSNKQPNQHKKQKVDERRSWLWTINPKKLVGTRINFFQNTRSNLGFLLVVELDRILVLVNEPFWIRGLVFPLHLNLVNNLNFGFCWYFIPIWVGFR